MDSDQTAPIGAVCSGSTLFASILNSSVMLGNYLQQTTFSDDVASDVGVNLCNVKSCLNTSNNEIFTDKRGDLPCVNISKHTCPVVK